MSIFFFKLTKTAKRIYKVHTFLRASDAKAVSELDLISLSRNIKVWTDLDGLQCR